MALTETDNGSSGGDGGESDIIVKTCVLGGFSESDETRALISSLPEVQGDMVSTESVTQRFLVIMNRYQEQPHLLDPHLDWMFNMILETIRNEKSPPSLVHLSFKFLYIICKVRGYKIFMQLFPHEVADVQPVLDLLSRQDPKDTETWETRYMLLLWLSMTCLIPFDLSRLDGHLESDGGKSREPIMDRILAIAKVIYINVFVFMTRPDVKQKRLGDFLDWSLMTITQTNDQSMTDIMVLDGALQSLAKLYKHGKREDLLQYAPTVLQCLEKKHLSDSSQAMLRKLGVKLIQRLGLTFLKPRLAAWRYQRGSRSLAANLSMSQTTAVTAAVSPDVETREQEEDYDIPEEVETVIEHLLVGLKDKETIVRWSAAKGIGRVTGRLPKELADEVVGSVLDCFSFQETDNAWHGGCLALAELGRRGLLLPSRLTDGKVLIYPRTDQKRIETFKELKWEKKNLQQHVDYDKSGRTGLFSLSYITQALFLLLYKAGFALFFCSVYIASFPEYTKAMIDHLVEMKINHWDGVIRELSTKALHNLTPQAPDYMATTVLPRLLPMAVGMDLLGRHGAILACAEITHALYKLGLQTNKTVVDIISSECVDGLKNIHQMCYCTFLNVVVLSRGFGGELMRPAVCGLIEKLSLSKLPFKNDPVITGWQWLIDDTIKTLHLVSSGAKDGIMTAVVSALSALCEEYYQIQPGQADPQMQGELNISLCMLTRCGSALALGSLPRFVIHSKMKQILEGLQQMCTVSQKEGSFPEARRDAVRAIAQVCVTAGVDTHGSPDSVLCSENVSEVYGTLLDSMNDYTTDSRGDVVVVFMSTLPDLCCSECRVKCMMCCLVQQAAEKIDRYRAHAGNIFLRLLHSTEPAVPHIPHREELLSIFPPETTASLNWNAPSQAFQYITQLLGLTQYQYHTLLGLTVSVGGITESTVGHLWWKSNTCYTPVSLFRVAIPFLKMLNQMLANSCFEIFTTQENHQFCVDLLTLCKEIKKSKDISKLRACISVFCGLIQFQGNVRKKVLSQLLMLLCHSFPVIRKTTASQMYEMVLTYDDVIDPEVLDDAMTILSDTNWEDDIPTVRTHRNQLADLLQVPRPQVIAKVTTEPTEVFL
uniref:Tubulin folding cofactor D n=1 Tax=Sphaeramia orbicularis TaxID=375764 RepID=A0A672ZUY0_9TELE